MKVILKNSELQFAKVKIITTSFQIDFTSGVRASKVIVLPNIQDVGTYFKIHISGDTDKLPGDFCYLNYGGMQRRDILLTAGDNILISDGFVNTIGVSSFQNATGSGTLYVTIEYAENNIDFDDMLTKMTKIGDITSEKPSGTPPSSIGPFNLDSTLPANHWYQFALIINNVPKFQFNAIFYSPNDAYLLADTIRINEDRHILGGSILNSISKFGLGGIIGNDASDINIEIYAYDIKEIL